MKVDVATAEHFATKFHTGSDGLKLGARTDVEVLSMEVHEKPEVRTGTQITVEVVVKLTARGVVPARFHICSVCGDEAPLPHDYDALWFILENHDGDRLLFAQSEDCEEERDSYPVKGWVESVGEELMCGDCATEMEEAKVAIKKRRSKVAG